MKKQEKLTQVGGSYFLTSSEVNNHDTPTVLLSFESNWKHGDFEPWFEIMVTGNLTTKRGELYHYIKEKFDREDLTWVETGNTYTFNETKFYAMMKYMTQHKTDNSYIILEGSTQVSTDPDVNKKDKGSYLFPVNYRIMVTNFNNIYTI